MLAWFARRRLRKRTAQNLYGSIVAAARRPEFYALYGVADTAEGRFEILVAHLLVLLERLRREGQAGRALAQDLVDAFFADMDTSARELGVGDMAVPKKMRLLAEVFDKRVRDYSAALAEDGDEALAGLIAANMKLARSGDGDRPARLAAYMRCALEALGRQSVGAISIAAGGAFVLPGDAEEETTR